MSIGAHHAESLRFMLQFRELEKTLLFKPNSLFVWLAETWTKRWPTVRKSEMLDLPWFDIEEGIQRLGEIGVLEWIYHLRPTHQPWGTHFLSQ